MPHKRRNNGKNRKNRGHVKNVVCATSNRLVPKDKAIKKYVIRDMIDGSSKEDIKKQSAFEGELVLPKMYHKLYYSISCAIHSRIVRSRSRTDRRVRTFAKKTKISQRPKAVENKDNKPATV